MEQIRAFYDQRLDHNCCYCGGVPDTQDHVPSKILLDDPFPENLPKVPCCNRCNQSFSLDEEYVACLIECIIHGTSEPDKLDREKIKRILNKKESLRQRISKSIIVDNDKVSFAVETDRLRNVALKLARGHTKFENSEPQLNAPIHFVVKPLEVMSADELQAFMSTSRLYKYPEVGSRALIQIIQSDPTAIHSRWIDVQEGSYRYQVSPSNELLSVRIVIWEYLAVEVAWD
jgi:hypothetical protein